MRVFTATKPKLDIAKIRQDFPALQQSVHGKPLVFSFAVPMILKPGTFEAFSVA